MLRPIPHDVNHSVLTVVTGVRPGSLEGLQQVLDEIGADPAANSVLPLASFHTLHFASLVLARGEGLEPHLIFESNVDGPVEDWLAALVDGGAAGVDRLYQHCVGYPGPGDPASVVAYLLAHVVAPGAYHIGATGRSLGRIRQEAELREAIEGFLDARTAAGSPDPEPAALLGEIQRFVRQQPALAWATEKCPPRQSRTERLGHLARLGAAGVGVVLLALLLFPLVVLLVLVLLVKERIDPKQKEPPDPAYVAALADAEDVYAQNHLASVIPVKPGPFRAALLPTVLWALNLIARVTATHGELGGIPSIHFAHWSVVNEGHHLLFLSNFDGSWESYLGDFIDKAATGLTAVWSNTKYFPDTVLLAFKGATDGPRFRWWARANQCPTAAWYSAYPWLTMSMIDNNSAIREGLFTTRPDQAQAWLDRL